MNTIFISIASYRDPELLPTLRNCIENAKHPENLRFGIAWQHSEEDIWDNLDEFKDDPRFDILNINHTDSQGVCWARNLIQGLYKNEKYYLQLDSHHRFISNWDVELIDVINFLQCKGHYKPILSAYLPSYFPNKDSEDPSTRLDEVWMLNIDRFLPEGAVFLRPQGLDGWRDMKEPVPSRFLSAHFIFTLGSFVTDVPYDPNFYFHGEETSLAARAYTHGYDLFNPHRVYIWHEYTREGKKKHWDDNPIWVERDKQSYARFRVLFEMNPEECSSCARKKLIPYVFGLERTLEQYERYAGLKFSTRQIHKYTLSHKPPPTIGDYEAGLCSQVKVCIDVWKEKIKEPDYESFVVALLDEEGNDAFRKDADAEEVKMLLNENPKDQFIHIWRDYEDINRPHSWRVWPYSKSKGWCDRIEQVIKYE